MDSQEMQPDHWHSHPVGRAILEVRRLNDAGDHAEAFALLKEVSKDGLESSVLVGWWKVAKAEVLQACGRLAEAEEILRQAIVSDDGFLPAWFWLGLVKEEQREYREAEECYLRLVKVRRSEDLLTMLAGVQAFFDREKAMQTINEALELNPDWEEAQKIKRLLEEASKEFD